MVIAGLVYGALLVGVAATAPSAGPDHASPAPPPRVLPRPDSPAPHHVATAGGALTPAEAALVDWAIGRFDEIGFELPVVRVSFYEDTAPCGGHDGRFVQAGGIAEISICVPDLGTAAFDLLRRRTLLHELAHAWDVANLDDADRDELLGIVAAASWAAPTSDPDQRGVERFAETLVWGLYDQLRRPVDIDVPCAELHADFVHITGSPALEPIEACCELPAPRPDLAPGV